MQVDDTAAVPHTPPPFSPRAAAKNACRRKHVLLDGHAVTVLTIVQPGQTVTRVARTSVAQFRALPGPGLEVVSQDDHMAVVVKPQGLPTQGKGQGTLQGRVKYCLAPSVAAGQLARPQQVRWSPR